VPYGDRLVRISRRLLLNDSVNCAASGHERVLVASWLAEFPNYG
jgi:hypothetical protein